MGELPEWYRLLRAARALGGLAPWELAEQPLIWQEWALSAESAENKARSEQERHARRKRKHSAG